MSKHKLLAAWTTLQERHRNGCRRIARESGCKENFRTEVHFSSPNGIGSHALIASTIEQHNTLTHINGLEAC